MVTISTASLIWYRMTRHLAHSPVTIVTETCILFLFVSHVLVLKEQMKQGFSKTLKNKFTELTFEMCLTHQPISQDVGVV